MTKAALGAVGIAVLAGGIWFLSKDDSIGFDPKVHTREELLEVLRECNLEFTCLYARAYNILFKMKENNVLSPQNMHDLRSQISQQVVRKTTQVLKSYEGKDYNETMLADWMQHFKDDKEVQELANKINKLEEDVFVHMKVEAITFPEKLPEELTKEMYVRIYRKIYAALRHDLYIRIKEEQKQTKKANVGEQRFAELYNEVHDKFNDVRLDIFDLMLGGNFEKKDAKRLMQMAYVIYATVS